MKPVVSFYLMILFIIPFCIFSQTKGNKDKVDEIVIKVQPNENREFSFTDKKFGYYYATTHSDYNDNYFSGWNINTKRVLKDYELFIDKKKLNRGKSIVYMYPNRILRKYDNCDEEFFLFDEMPVIAIKMSSIKGKEISIRILGDLHKIDAQSDKGIFIIPNEDQKSGILITTFTDQPVKITGDTLTASKNANGFLFFYFHERMEVVEFLSEFRKECSNYILERKARMNNLLYNNFLTSNDKSLVHALEWINLTLDELITNQMGWGIYAGLPWFNDYWGRDLFISMPGACLVTGQFEQAKKILLSFAKFQNQDKDSKYYGRIPNRARPDEIIYNTTDGTPRFIIEILDYINYTGDKSIIPDLYPVVKKSIEGSVRYWVDEKGYLTHDDADTWMDAREKGVRPFSPRGNRANDIQSLWFQQLKAGIIFAEYMNDIESLSSWKSLTNKLKEHFIKDFFDGDYRYMADRITSEGKKDFKLRPNQLYAYELVDNIEKKYDLTKIIWESLVYPWGVASLSQTDEDFYPYHENWHYYHKDAAYHNGTVWLWNNGMAMQRMIEAGQKDIAYRLFKNMNRQALDEGAVGSLSENADALPRDGKNWANRSGTFLQAWSNAEQLRIWSQFFLGIKPALERDLINLSPNIPTEINSLNYTALIGKGRLTGSYKKDKQKRYTYKLESISAKVDISIEGFNTFSVELSSGYSIEINENISSAIINLKDAKNKKINSFTIQKDKNLLENISRRNRIFKDVKFCEPMLRKNLKSLSKFHEKPLTY